MAKVHEDDLFKRSTMTFGDHLEELRACLIRAVLWLLAGFSIGLYMGDWVVSAIQVPLRGALTEYYSTRTRVNYEKWVTENPEWAGSFTAEDINRTIGKKESLFDVRYVYLPDIIRHINEHSPGLLDEKLIVKEQGDRKIDDSGFLPIMLWHSIEDDPRVSLKTLASQEAFMIWLKASFLAGVVIASPFIFYHIWRFVAAGLYPHERRYVHIFGPFSAVLFLAGAALCFFVVFQFVLKFLFGFNAWMGLDPDMRISEWLGFALFLPIGFGISFQLPLVMLFLERIEMYSVQSYVSKWRIAVLVIAVISMLLTPADPMSMILMAVPLVGLYFGGIMLCLFFPRRGAEV